MSHETKIPKGYERVAELAARYSEARDSLWERANRIREIKRMAGNRLVKGLQLRVATVSAAKDALRQEIEEHPELWTKPRTRALHGVKVGRRSLPGRLEIDPGVAIPRIRQLLPGRAKDLIRTRETLAMAAVKALGPAELEAIGGSIANLADETVIAIPKDVIDELVETLLEDFEDSDG
ncbi:MAG: hypothetical protein F4Y04_05620 [Chloroflexi bacterium]|nr:hypothetical protein [Chloroflexota bacterium]